MTATARSRMGATTYTRPDEYPALDLLTYAAADPSRPSWADQVDALLDVRGLEDDWDGQGALAPNPALVDGAITLAQRLQAAGFPPADFAVAGVNGTVIFEWHGQAEYLEVEVIAPDRAELRRVRKGSEVAEVFGLTLR